MKEIFIFIIISGVLFTAFTITTIIGLVKKNRKVMFGSLFIFILFIGSLIGIGYKVVRSSFTKVSEMLAPRTGNEIYTAIFDKPQYDCLKIISYRDQIIPKVDDATWLFFETCPKELERILSKHDYSIGKLSTISWDGIIPYGETIDWFNPKSLGDSIFVYEYATEDSRNIQTIWASLDSTKVFCRDILD